MPDPTLPSLSMLLADRSRRPALLPPLPPAQMPLPPIPPIAPSANVQNLSNLQGPPLPQGLYPGSTPPNLPPPPQPGLGGPMPRDAGYYDINRLMDALATQFALRTMTPQSQFARRTMTPQQQFPEINMQAPTSPQNPDTGLPVIPGIGIRG
jgi:hypothetical protein